jgi:phosphonate transport system ATP-binding protein
MLVLEKNQTIDLKIVNVKKAYKDLEVLKGVSFNIADGESVALIGSNGSGKSTLLRTIPALHPHDSGEIEVLGEQISKCHGRALRALRSRIGFVFQKHNLVPRLSVLTNIIHGLQGAHSDPRYWFQSFAPSDARRKALDCLEQVGLADIAKRRVDRLSGGQSQRVAIARALMQSPEIILADEPVASLDPVAGTEVMALLHKLTHQKSITLLFTSHHLEHTKNYADRVIGLRDGQIVLSARTSDVSLNDLRRFYDRPSSTQRMPAASSF